LDDATALHVCADCGASELVRDLLNAGADANAKEANGCCALHLAATHGDAATTQILLPVTTPNTRVQPWSVDSVLAAAAAGVFAKASKPCSVQRVANSAASSERPTDAGATIQSEQHSPPSPEAAARAEARKVAGDALFRSGNCAGAAEHYTAALEDDPHNAVLLSNRSVARLRCGDEQGALADAERAQQLRPQWSKAYFRLGTALHALRRFEEAAQALFQGVQLEPDNVEMARAFRQAVEDGREAYKEEQRKAFSAAHTVTR
jgi:tetratricopeptide (TPR) repeat protein